MPQLPGNTMNDLAHTSRPFWADALPATLIAFLLALLPLRAEAVSQVLVLAAGEDTVSEISATILKEAYARLGVAVQFEQLPGMRAVQMVEEGTIDGLVNRIAEFGKDNAFLVRVAEPVNRFDVYAFAADECPDIRSLKDLEHRLVGIRFDRVYADRLKEQLHKVVEQPTFNRLFDLLAAGRVEVALASGIMGDIEAERLSKSRIQRCGPPLASFALHHYLHPRHVELARRLDRELKAMRREGRFEAIRQQVLERHGLR